MPSAAAPAAQTRQARAEALAARLYAEHRPRLLALARHNCGNPDDAEEALQDTFVLFIDHFDPGGEAPPLPWLSLYADLCVMPTLSWKPACRAEIALRRSA